MNRQTCAIAAGQSLFLAIADRPGKTMLQSVSVLGGD